MRKLLILAAVIAGGTLQAQNDSDDQNKKDYRTRKNEISLGMFNAFDLDASPTPVFTYKKYTDQGAMRLSLRGRIYTNDGDRYAKELDDLSIIDYTDEYRIQTVNLGVGYEWHEELNRWMLFYGFDVNAGYHHVKDYLAFVYDEDYIKQEESTLRQVHQFSAGLMPFIGMKFWVNNRISLNTQLNLRFVTRFTNGEYAYLEDHLDDYDHRDRYVTSDYFTQNYSLDLSKLGLVSVNFHF